MGLFITLLFLQGCFAGSSMVDRSARYAEVDKAIYSGGFEAGLQQIVYAQGTNKPIYDQQNAVSLFLDKGLLEHYAGDYTSSSSSLQNAERLIREAYTKSISENVSSYLLNDNTKEYPGEDFEDIYLNVFNALNYYHRGNMDGALVEIRKLTFPTGKLSELQRKYDDGNERIRASSSSEMSKVESRADASKPIVKNTTFSNSALARYLSVLFYEAEQNYDAVRIEKDQLLYAYQTQSGIYSNNIPKAIENIGTERIELGVGSWELGVTHSPLPTPHSPLPTPNSESARLDIISFTGLSPVKKEETFTQFFPFFNNPIYWWIELKLPVLIPRQNRIQRVEILIGNERFNLELIENISAVIEDTYNARFTNVFLKTYIRTLSKYIAQDLVSNAVDKKTKDESTGTQLLALFGKVAAKVAVDATERADVRMARYLPDKAYIGNINLPPGIYDITINYYGSGRILHTEKKQNINVLAGALNLIQSVCLDISITEEQKK